MESKTDTWLPEIVASIVVSIFVGATAYRWVRDDLSQEVLLVFLLVVATAVVTIFGVDKVKHVLSLWRDQ